jgi:hypothetical protein
MSSLFYRRWRQYFQIPIAGSIERLRPSGYRYYGFLCREMNVRSAVDLRYSNAEIAKATGIKDHKTLAKARRELQAARLIQCFKVPPGVYAHVMLDESGNPIPAPEDRRGIRHYENADARENRKAQSEQLEATPAPAPNLMKNEPSRLSETKSLPITTENSRGECRTHGRVPHWKRGEDWICELCHPNPWRPPTADEVGFW